MATIETRADELIAASALSDTSKLSSLLAQATYQEAACSLRNVPFFLTYLDVPIANLMLRTSLDPPNPSAANLICDFARENSIPADSVVTQWEVLPAIKSAAGVELLDAFYCVEKDVANTDCDYMWNPLSYASYHGKSDVVKWLLEHGADPNKWCAHHEAHGHYLCAAAQYGHVETIRTLLEHGALVNGSGALHMAAEKNNTQCLQLMVEKGGDMNDRFGNSVSFYDENGVSEDERMRRANQTPLDVATGEAAEWLSARGARKSVEDGGEALSLTTR